MFFEILAVLALGSLSVYGLYQLVILMESKLLKDVIAKNAIILIAVEDNDDVEFLIRSVSSKIKKLNISKNSTIMLVDCGLKDEGRKIIQDISLDIENVVLIDKLTINAIMSNKLGVC